MRAIVNSTNNNCCEALEIFCPIPKDQLVQIVEFLYHGEIPCQNTNQTCQILNNLTDVFGFPSRMKLNLPKIKCKFCLVKFHIQNASQHVLEEIEKVMKISKLKIKYGQDVICHVCNSSIEYKTEVDKENAIRNHYINLHSGDIFCNPHEKVI